MNRVYALQLSNFHPSATLPQAIGSLWSYMFQFEAIRDSYKLERVFWENEDADLVLKDIKDPQVLLCSCYVWNWSRTLEVMTEVKRKYPNCLIIAGGPEPEYSVEFMQAHPMIDILIPYYGEESLKQVLVKNLSERDFSEIGGIITKDFYNRERLGFDLSDIESPYLNGFYDKLLAQKRPETKSVRVVYESNRGCPFSCTFCDIGDSAYTKIRTFDLDRCKNELEWIVTNNISTIDVADANFGMFQRDEELVDYLIELKWKHNWKGRFLPTWSKKKGQRVLSIAKKIIKNGLDSVFGLSLQSIHQDTLKNVKRTNAFDLEELSTIVQEMNKDKVNVYTEFIFPMPGDTLEIFKNSIYQVLDMEHPFNKFQINHLSRFNNTQIASQNSQSEFEIEWVDIKGFTRHYYGKNLKDTIAVSMKGMSREDVFEGLFFAKCFVIPIYFYGTLRKMIDELLAKEGIERSEFVKKLYQNIHSLESFKTFKQQQKDHYFAAIDKGAQFGQVLSEDANEFFPEFAIAHQYYLNSDFYDFLRAEYTDYRELIDFSEKTIWRKNRFSLTFKMSKYLKGTWSISDERQVDLNNYLQEVYVSGRFDDRWQSQSIRKIEAC